MSLKDIFQRNRAKQLDTEPEEGGDSELMAGNDAVRKKQLLYLGCGGAVALVLGLGLGLGVLGLGDATLDRRVALGEGLRLGEITVAYGNYFDAFESTIVLGVLPRHAARANNRNTDHLKPSSPGLCRLSPLISTGLGAWSAGTLGQLSIHREPSGCAQTTAFLSTRFTCSS